jgi:His/Glu/Gln/Arg/opine family amino acid ABC transporter permease subunit
MIENYVFHWSLVTDQWPILVAGAWIDLWASLLGFALACCVGIVFALARRSGNALLSGLAATLVEVARGVPPYVLLLWVHYGLSRFIGLAFTPMQSMVAVLAFTGSGYAAEIFRSGIAAVDHGQFEAAHSLGMSRIGIYRDVILPQSVQPMIAPLGNVLIGLLKVATLMGVIAVPDLLHHAQDINMNYFAPFEAFTAVLVIFVAMVFTVSLCFMAVERALERP